MEIWDSGGNIPTTGWLMVVGLENSVVDGKIPKKVLLLMAEIPNNQLR